ncbi:lysosomal aspartic protease-like [Coccinella septempunctata]|uniref:lysosomal aspartic protease-like n=1 Tax=Coccinella septempunctata TaxID=41139 RepID=UPI001D08E3A6|nr:lysosomal aspartic protease-like [Coccinella septempunctata]
MMYRIFFSIFFLLFALNFVHCKPPVCNITSSEYEGLNFIEHNATMRIQIVRQKSPFEQQLNSPLHEFGLIRDWYEKPKPSNRTNDTVRLYRFLNNEFYGKIIVGHPGQALNVAFDTTWIYTWLLSSQCSALEEIGCYFHNKYNHHASSEWKPDGRKFSVVTDGVNLTGFYSYDNISITHSSVTNFNFIEMTAVPKSFIFNKADGVLGLGWGTGSGYKTFFAALLEQKKIKNPIFSVYINRNHQSNAAGDITLGFADGRHIKVDYVDGKYVCDKIIYLKTDPLPYWQFQMDKVLLVKNPKNTKAYCQTKFPDGTVGCKAVIDTSSNMIIGPAKEITDLHNEMGATKLIFGRYSVECDKINQLPPIEFIIGGKNFTLKGPNYITRFSYRSLTICVSAFQAAENDQEETRWILGGAFLSEVYTIYDYHNHVIGLVRAA